MYTLTKSFTINCEHRLLDHKGNCQQLHGHTFTILFGLCCEVPIRDVVVDFDNLTKILEVWLLDTLDHKLLLFEDDPIALMFGIEPEILEDTISRNEVMILVYNPTSENIARYICESVEFLFPQIYQLIQFVEVSATPSTSARFYPKEEVNHDKS